MLRCFLAASLVMMLLAAAAAQTGEWEFVGPTTYAEPANPSAANSGAAQAIVDGHNGTFFLGTVNGGIFRTRNILASHPHWEPVTDSSDETLCSSIGAIAVDKQNPLLVAAGCGGATSGEMGIGW